MLSGCVGDGGQYPSLAVRDVERVGYQTPRPEAIPASPVISAADLAAMLADAQEFHSRFDETRPGVALLADRAAQTTMESDVRSRALIALADLTALHGRTALALGDLDRLEAEALGTFAPVEAIRDAQQRVADWVQTQDEALTDIENTIGL